MDSRNNKQRRSLLSSPDSVNGQFLPGFLKVRLGLRFRDCPALFGSQIMKPEAENKEHRDD
jgi:hypothetical protein